MKILLIDTAEENENKNYSDVTKLLDNTKIAFTSINITEFNDKIEYYFIHFDFVIIDFIDEKILDIELVEKYKNYSKVLFVPIVYLFETIELSVLSKNIILDNFDYLLHPIKSKDIDVKIEQYFISKDEKRFENCKMIIKGQIVNKLEHQWKQPLNYISTNLINLEIKSELGKLEHNSIETITRNIESAIMKISNNIALVNQCFQVSNHQTDFTLDSVIEKNLDIVLYRMIQNNIKLEKNPKNLNNQINNYENDFALNIMLFLYILVEWSITEKKEKEEEVIIDFSCEKDEQDIYLCIGINKPISFSSILKNFKVEIYLIKNLLLKIKTNYTSYYRDDNTLFKIKIEKEKQL